MPFVTAFVLVRSCPSCKNEFLGAYASIAEAKEGAQRHIGRSTAVRWENGGRGARTVGIERVYEVKGIRLAYPGRSDSELPRTASIVASLLPSEG
jgi:seryl-tRNA synthetase